MSIIMYTTHCPNCNVLAKKMKDANLEYEVVDDIKVMLAKGFRSAPMLEVDGVAMDFLKANKWLNETTK